MSGIVYVSGWISTFNPFSITVFAVIGPIAAILTPSISACSSFLSATSSICTKLVTVDELEIVRDNQIFPKVKVKLALSTFVSL